MKDHVAFDDASVIREVVAGNVNAFEKLLKQYQGFVMAIVKKHVPLDHVEDTAQEVFLRLYSSLSSLKNNGNFKHWLSVIAVRACHDFWRERYRSREMPISALTEHHQMWLDTALADTSDQLFQERARQKEAREILDWALERLSAEDRMVLGLVYFEEYSIREATRLLGLSMINVKVRLFRARKKLRAIVSKIIDEGVINEHDPGKS